MRREKRSGHSLPSKGYRSPRGLQCGLPAISMGAHGALLTVFSNDCDPVPVYAQQAFAYAQPGDALLGISTSGNAENVCTAVMAARARGARTLALMGRDGGRLRELADYVIVAPESETYRIQECHLAIYYHLCAAVEAELFR